MRKIRFDPKQTKIMEIAAWTAATAVVVGAFVYYAFFDKIPETKVAKVGETCPDFTVTTYAEREDGYHGNQGYFSLSENLGKVVVVNFWATWCGPCVEEIPHFNELYKKYEDDIEMIVINGDVKEPDVSSFLTAMWSGYSVTFGQDSEASAAYATLSETATMPVTLIIDEEGILRERIYEAFKSEEELETLLLTYLND